MAYTQTTYGSAKTQLSARLHDANETFFTDIGTYPEIEAYLNEALRTWQVLTAYWRTQESFSTSASTIFYDLEAELTNRTFSIVDTELVEEIQYHLLETADGTTWNGTEQFTLADCTYALERRRDQFLAETGCHITRAQQAATTGRTTIPETTVDVRRVAWVAGGTTYTQLTREDEWGLQGYSSSWDTSGTPASYSIAASPPVTIQLAPPPSAAGNIEVLSVRSGASLDPANGVEMGIPDDFCWVVKWGALADLLGKDGPGYDPSRAGFCEKRYQMGVELARNAVCIIQAEVNSSLVPVSSLYELDMYTPGWQNTTDAAPTEVVSAGLNMVACNPTPDGAYTVTLDVVQNAPIPASDATNLQIGPEELEAIIDYAEHLAMFKIGGDEWQATQPQYDNFIKVAQNYRERVGAMVRYVRPLAIQSLKEEVTRPRRKGEANA